MSRPPFPPFTDKTAAHFAANSSNLGTAESAAAIGTEKFRKEKSDDYHREYF